MSRSPKPNPVPPSNHVVRAVTLSLAIATAALIPAAHAQSIPRMPDGKPDFSGIWQSGGVSLYGDPATQPRPAANAAPAPRPQAAPYQEWALPKIKEYTDDLGKADPIARCFLPGVPRITTMPMPFEIMQKSDRVAILYEAFHAFRIIPINGAKHPDDVDPSFMGDSAARWDGDTLVVDVTGFNDKTWLDGRGHFHSDQLHVVERYRLTPDNTIALEVTMEDPKVLTKPWVVNYTLRHPPRADRVMEYECLENNQDLPHLVGPKQAERN
jgi:hypothetical protein